MIIQHVLLSCRASSASFAVTHHEGPVLEKSRARTTGADHIQCDYGPEASKHYFKLNSKLLEDIKGVVPHGKVPLGADRFEIALLLQCLKLEMFSKIPRNTRAFNC